MQIKHTLTLMAILLSGSLFSQRSTKHFTLSEGYQIKAALLQDISGKTLSNGQSINFELSDPIIINDRIVVDKGTKITGTVTEAEGAKAFGKKGKLSFTIDYLYLSNGKVVKLRSSIKKNINGSGTAVAAGAILVSPVALLFNGKQAKFKAGEVFAAYIDKDYTF
ncbi:hypothetical protein ACFOW1_11540 [Parasediminibacterium paludis]|uniref:Uncharacterized protein n=1 Tax=Parasediminibacterium paludis TaxID=908966 RepID=A0ABV8PZU4_9BACT